MLLVVVSAAHNDNDDEDTSEYSAKLSYFPCKTHMSYGTDEYLHMTHSSYMQLWQGTKQTKKERLHHHNGGREMYI